MDHTGVKIIDTRKFKIQNLQNDMKKIQYLNFGLNDKIPSCLCYTWTKSAYPHKYLFPIFQKFAASNYDTFSELHRKLYLNLDDFEYSIQTENFLYNNGAVINDENKRQ